MCHNLCHQVCAPTRGDICIVITGEVWPFRRELFDRWLFPASDGNTSIPHAKTGYVDNDF